MGGDRDGNPNVTAHITRHVLLLSRWKNRSVPKDIQVLVSELSMVEATSTAGAGWRRRCRRTVSLSTKNLRSR
ncbi:phosphoenolpyruvate carboxylase [Escherichia coli]